MWDLIVSVPDHCLSFYFEEKIQSADFILDLAIWQQTPKISMN